MSGSSSWNDSPYAFAPNTNTMDAQSMPSDKAEAARRKAKEVMLALEDGKPGSADAMMGKPEPKGTTGITPLHWMMSKFTSNKSKKEKTTDDGVVR